MMRRHLVIACCLLLVVTSIRAQSRGAKPDPLTGTWTGELSPQPDRRLTVTMQLKFDGKSSVTGTVSGLPNPADVKKGSFDPKTGALKLELGRTDDPAVLLTLDGKVEKGTATGQVSGDGSGTFKVTKKP
jgi:hypothetical protein